MPSCRHCGARRWRLISSSSPEFPWIPSVVVYALVITKTVAFWLKEIGMNHINRWGSIEGNWGKLWMRNSNCTSQQQETNYLRLKILNLMDHSRRVETVEIFKQQLMPIPQLQQNPGTNWTLKSRNVSAESPGESWWNVYIINVVIYSTAFFLSQDNRLIIIKVSLIMSGVINDDADKHEPLFWTIKMRLQPTTVSQAPAKPINALRLVILQFLTLLQFV